MSALLRSHAMRWLSALVIGAVATAAAWADPPGRVGRLAEVSGQVWMYDDEAGEWVAAVRNHPLTSGDRLSTERDARAVIEVGSSTWRLDEHTEFEIVRLDDAAMHVSLQTGSVAMRLRSAESAGELELTTAEGRFVPQGPGHFRIDRDDRVSSATAWSGALQFRSDDSELGIEPGRQYEFWREDERTHYSWRDPETDPFADWAVAEDARDDRRSASRYVSPEMTGADDLDDHGRWEHSSEYGRLWVPYHVAPGWAPYRHGHWSWVAPWGWTWVDHAPWGFAPFHYGRWVHFAGRWCWSPGSYIARPVYAPALVAWVGRPRVSAAVNIGARPPAVGWFPLAPREPYVPTYRASKRYLRSVNVTHAAHVDPVGWQAADGGGAAMRYANRFVPNAITAVTSDVIGRRQPVAPHADARIVREIEREPVRIGLPVASLISRPDPRPHAGATRARVVPVPPHRLGAETRPMRQRSERWVRADERPTVQVLPPVAPPAAAPLMRGLSTATSPGQGPSTASPPGAGPSTRSAPIVRPPDHSFVHRPVPIPRHDADDDGRHHRRAHDRDDRGRGRMHGDERSGASARPPMQIARPAVQVPSVQVPAVQVPPAQVPHVRVSPVPLQRPALPPQAAAPAAPQAVPAMREPMPQQHRRVHEPAERGVRGSIRERER